MSGCSRSIRWRRSCRSTYRPAPLAAQWGARGDSLRRAHRLARDGARAAGVPDRRRMTRETEKRPRDRTTLSRFSVDAPHPWFRREGDRAILTRAHATSFLRGECRYALTLAAPERATVPVRRSSSSIAAGSSAEAACASRAAASWMRGSREHGAVKGLHAALPSFKGLHWVSGFRRPCHPASMRSSSTQPPAARQDVECRERLQNG